MSTALLIVILVQAALTIAGSVVAWKLLLPAQLAEQPAGVKPTKLQYVGSGIQCFMIGFFWFIFGPGYGIYKLVQRSKK